MSNLTAQTWRQIIIPYEIACDYENPFLDVSIQATFTGPEGQQITREAYWDGGRSYKVSFAPTAVGQWTWTVAAPAETGLAGTTGELTCVPYEGELPIYKHGFLKVDPSKRFLTYADGTPFFWLGDTHWAFAYQERWGESNHPDMKCMFRGMADRRAEQGYTVYQTNLRSDPSRDAGRSKYWVDGQLGKLPAVEFYQNELDRRMYYLADLGLVNALGLCWFMSIMQGAELWKNHARYMIARYGALPMCWTLVGETAGYSAATRQQFIDGWREVALYIEATDSYGNLQTAHYDNIRPFSDYYYDEDWFDFTLNQAGHGDFPVQASDFQTYRREHPDKPFIEGESLYEFCSTLEAHGTRLCTPAMVRRVAYTAIQLGACGYTYGAQGIWDNVWEPAPEPNPFNTFNKFNIPWYTAIDGEGGAQMGLMKKFYEEENFTELTPIAVATVSPFGVSGENSTVDMFSHLATSNEDRTHLIVYYNEMTRGGCRISQLTEGTYTAEWFDPRTAERTAIGEFTPVDGCYDAPARAKGGDWVLVIRKK